MDSEFVPGDAKSRRSTRGRRRETQNISQDFEKKINRNQTESRRVERINEQYDRLVELLGGIVNGAKKSRVWERNGKEGKLRKLDILEATTTYIQGLVEELENVKANGDVSRLHVVGAPPLTLCAQHIATTVEQQQQSAVTSNSPVELGCEEIIPEDILADDESDIEMSTSGHDKPQLQLPLPPPPQALPIGCVEVFTFSPDELQGCLQPTQNLYKAALNTCSPGDSLLPSLTVSALSHPPEISPDLFKSNGGGFPHFTLSGFCCDAVPPLSPEPGEGVSIPSYLTDSPYANGPPLY